MVQSFKEFMESSVEYHQAQIRHHVEAGYKAKTREQKNAHEDARAAHAVALNAHKNSSGSAEARAETETAKKASQYASTVKGKRQKKSGSFSRYD